MFDDQPAASGPSVPNNLPLNEPQDIFESTESSPLPPLAEDGAAAPLMQSQPFAQQTSALEAGILRPKQEIPSMNVPPRSMPQNISGLPPMMNNTPQEPLSEVNSLKEPKLSHGIMITIMVVVVGFILVGSGWFVYRVFTKDSPEQTPLAPLETEVIPPQIVEEVPIVPVGVTPLEEEITVTSTSAIDQEILLGESLDSDGDGLKDNRETELGTDPNSADTDSDGLSDGEELLIWHTNPKNSDTDGDTYKDGDEVRAGYSPSGPGRLAETVPSFQNNTIINNATSTPPATTSADTTVSSSPSSTSTSSSSQGFEIEL